MAFLDSFSKVHCIGAGGIGLSAVAKLLQAHGKTVTGSDVAENEAVRELKAKGITIEIGHKAENVSRGTDLVIFSGAVPRDNPERVAATEQGIPTMEYFAFLGEYSKEKKTICISGTNGKSTTTALLGLMLEAAGFDPTIIVGSKVPNFPDQNLRLGKSEWLVVEACEHMAHMLLFHPYAIVLTNIEEDHLDFYRDIAHIHETFQQYVNKLPANGLLVRNADDARCASLTTPAKAVSYSAEGKDLADYQVAQHSTQEGKQVMTIVQGGTSLGEFELRVPGAFNRANALAAAAMALEIGVQPEQVRQVLGQFHGLWRRFESVGSWNGAELISDYGHHPTAVSGTVAAAKEFYQNKRIILIFQPHHRNRTKKLFTEFVESFDAADVVLLQEIYDVAGREHNEDSKVSSQDLVQTTLHRDLEQGRTRPVEYMANQDAIIQWIRKNAGPNDIVLFMGAGDLYKVAERVLMGK